MNTFNFSGAQFINIKQNQQHQFACNHSMQIYPSNAIYSFIPKNGCSTMRLSIAKANGCIDNIDQGHWIHHNNHTFVPSLKEAFLASYTFVILRCPFRRLASVYLDKFVRKENDAWQYQNLLKRSIDLDKLTFADFVKSLQAPHLKNANIHWKPQASFLLYKNYNDYFSLEHFNDAASTLKQKINLDVIDARSLTNHGTDQYTLLNDNFYGDVCAFEIAVLKNAGKCPMHEAMYNDELIDLVTRFYAEDIQLYKAKCNSNDMLFNV